MSRSPGLPSRKVAGLAGWSAIAFSFLLTFSADAQAQVSLENADVLLAADRIREWKDNNSHYFLLEGANSFVEQGLRRIRCDECIVRVTEPATFDGPTVVELAARGNLRVEPKVLRKDTTEPVFHSRLQTRSKVLVKSSNRESASASDHPLYQILTGRPVAAAPSAEKPSQIRPETAKMAPAPTKAGATPLNLLTKAEKRAAPLARGEKLRAQATPSESPSPSSPLARGEKPTREASGWQNANANGGAVAVAKTDNQVQKAQLVVSGDQASNPGASNLGVRPEEPANREQDGPPQVRDRNAPTRFNPTISPMQSGGDKGVRAYPRASEPFHSDSFATADGQQVFVFSGGINLIVDDLTTGERTETAADRAVLWTKGNLTGQVSGTGATTGSQQPLEVYLEGNVIVSQSTPRIAKASNNVRLIGRQVYYNLNNNRALILDGVVETYDDLWQIPLFVRADEIRQLTPQKFFAREAGFTTSPYRGTPGYEFQAREIVFEELRQEIHNPFTGAQIIDPQTGEPMIRSRFFATGYNNVLRVEDFPVFYWPYLKVDVNDPLGPIEEVKVGQTRNLGFYLTLGLDMWQLLGLDYLPIADRSNWLLDVGYFGDRGVAGGSRFNYFGSDPFGIDGSYYGNMMTWWIDDGGLDFLGINRQDLEPARNGRGRVRAQHFQHLPNDMKLIAELSYLSDTNILESFFEVEYDTGKDQDTLVYLAQGRDYWQWSLLFQPRLNEFLPQNPWLPRADGHILGLSLLDDRLTYFSHSSVGYAYLRPPRHLLLADDVRLETVRGDTRHEIDLPIQMGAVNFTPFVIGQATGYSEAVDADGLGRLYAAGGFRSSLPFWNAYRGVESHLFNVHGLAHKVVLSVDYLYAYSNRDFQELPLLDQVDDDTSEIVRRQTLIRTFGGVVPLRYDPRFFALRQNVTNQPEILDDMHNIRLGMNQRLQTKRGPIDRQRIMDWMVLDLGTTIFPDQERDNFGNLAGLIEYRYLWNIGDRTSFVSTALYEPYDETLVATVGMNFVRPPRSMLGVYLGHYSTGPFESNYVALNNAYRFSHKYAGSVNIGYDFATPDNVSFNLGFSRVGLDFVLSTGIVLNAGRDDLGFTFEIVPRVQARTQYGRAFGSTLPFGVESSEPVAPIASDRLSTLNTGYSN